MLSLLATLGVGTGDVLKIGEQGNLMDTLVGTRVELTTDTLSHRAGERGVIASCKGHIGVLFDGYEGLCICFAGMPITNFIQAVEDEREPAPTQLSLFQD
jgi:hypothetical protein